MFSNLNHSLLFFKIQLQKDSEPRNLILAPIMWPLEERLVIITEQMKPLMQWIIIRIQISPDSPIKFNRNFSMENSLL